MFAVSTIISPVHQILFSLALLDLRTYLGSFEKEKSRHGALKWGAINGVLDVPILSQWENWPYSERKMLKSVPFFFVLPSVLFGLDAQKVSTPLGNIFHKKKNNNIHELLWVWFFFIILAFQTSAVKGCKKKDGPISVSMYKFQSKGRMCTIFVRNFYAADSEE